MSVRQRSEPVNHDRWLVSYADFVTLLFAFFVVLYATAQVDRQRAVGLSDAIRSGFQELWRLSEREPPGGHRSGRRCSGEDWSGAAKCAAHCCRRRGGHGAVQRHPQ
jgi:flagellar motor protein MotB